MQKIYVRKDGRGVRENGMNLCPEQQGAGQSDIKQKFSGNLEQGLLDIGECGDEAVQNKHCGNGKRFKWCSAEIIQVTSKKCDYKIPIIL